jgi:hypothetical protein
VPEQSTSPSDRRRGQSQLAARRVLADFHSYDRTIALVGDRVTVCGAAR